MSFYLYDGENRQRFSESAQRQLDNLQERFGAVEIRELTASSEWCVRITQVDAEGERLPLAALGDTIEDAASRLIRISQAF